MAQMKQSSAEPLGKAVNSWCRLTAFLPWKELKAGPSLVGLETDSGEVSLRHFLLFTDTSFTLACSVGAFDYLKGFSQREAELLCISIHT